MLTTRINIPGPLRSEIAAELNRNLAQAIDLALAAKQAHWNVKGPNFGELHRLFDELASAASSWADTMAERIAAFALIAEGTLAAVVQRTSLPPYPVTLLDGAGHVKALADRLSLFGNTIREAIERTLKLRDNGTADIYTEISRAADKLLWMLEATERTEKTTAL